MAWPWRVLVLFIVLIGSGSVEAGLLQTGGSTNTATPLGETGPSTTTTISPLRSSLDEDAHHTIEFVCPVAQTGPSDLLPPPGQAHLVVPGCPLRVYDYPWSFGSPDIAVHPTDHRQVAFFSLHGNHVEDGATERARSGAPHTTFTSRTQGLQWEDQPEFTPGRYGEGATGTMDMEGNLYFAYHYTQPVRNGHESTLNLYIADPVTNSGNVQRAYMDPYQIDAVTPGGHFTRAHMIRVDEAPADIREPAAITGPVGVENESALEDRPEHMVLVWHEETGETDAGLGAGWIDAAWIVPGDEDWTRLDREHRIGPCSGMSNPISFAGSVYVACTVAEGYDARKSAKPGDIDVWRLDPMENHVPGLGGGNATFLAPVGLKGGHTNLAGTADGYMMLTAGNRTDGGGFSAKVAFGWYGWQWQAIDFWDLGVVLHGLLGNQMAQDAHITALELSTSSRTAVLVYKEWQQSEVNEIDPDGEIPELSDFRKVVVTMDQCEGPLAASEFSLGKALAPHHAEEYTRNPGGFNDIKDGIQLVQEPTGQEVAYFAVNDYGSIQYGGLLFTTGFCNPPQPVILPHVPIAVLPQGLTVANPGMQYVGAGVGAVSLAMVGYLLALKRKAANPLAAEDRR